MLRVSIKTYGKDLKTLRMDLEKFRSKLEAEIPVLGKEVHTFMTSFINANRKRPGGTENLANSITFEANKKGFAIGNINVLNEKARYWKAINYGSAHIIDRRVPVGKFIPGEEKPSSAHFRKGRWFRTWGMEENYSFIPKRPIPAMDFIERTNHYLRIQLARLLRKVRIK